VAIVAGSAKSSLEMYASALWQSSLLGMKYRDRHEPQQKGAARTQEAWLDAKWSH
jgi:hypothetical protein